MMRWFFVLLFLVLGARTAAAQEDPDFERVALRVIEVRPGSIVVVDRGTSDGLARGDRVLFHPREGGVHAGTITQVDDRTAIVELQDLGRVLARGTRGEVRVPVSRFEVPEADPVTREGEEVPADHPPWERKDEDWTADMPLLAQVRAVHPAARPRRITGRVYVLGDWTYTTRADRADSFQRVGTDFEWDNPFGRGAVLHFDAEYNRRTTELPDRKDESRTDLRVDRLSYLYGGTRFAPQRHEAGRFLQHGMPEFGVLDGYEWGVRRRTGHRFGASIGYMPQPDSEYDPGHDFQVSGHYQWVADPRERTALAGGYQRTFHDGAADRDLFVARFHHLPVHGWQYYGATWFDWYTGGELVKDSGVELTRALATARRESANGDGLEFGYSRLRLVDQEREELFDVDPWRIREARRDRVSARTWLTLANERRLHTQLGAWLDENDHGGDAELGIELPDLLADGSRTDFTGFLGRGEFETFLGGRVRWSAPVDNGRWDVFYELANHDFAGFAPNNDDLPQHRLRVSRDLRTSSGWTMSFHLDGVVWDEQAALTAGFFLQRSYLR